MNLREAIELALSPAYVIEAELGGGGMARVFLAREVALKRRVVVKVLPPELAGAVSLDRFKREIELAAQLQHPHIVPVLAAGQTTDITYYTMPFVEGQSLRAKLAHGEMPVADAIRVLRDVAAALAYAHKHGVVHRDIKPDNVLLSDGYAVVTDFGVAKAISSSTTSSDGGITSLGVALGTPAYMAPEQAAAEPNVDHRADIYAFGVLAYELLTGASPFAGRPAAAQLSAHITEVPEPVERRRPNIPTALAAVVRGTLEKRAADRPQSADELVRALDGVVTTPTQSPPAPRGRRRSWMAIASTATLVGAGIVGAVVVARPTRGPPIDNEVIAVFPFRVSSANPGLEYLKEGGLPDLLSIKLSSGAGMRATDVSAVLNAWKRAGGGDLPAEKQTSLAADLGAGQLITGEVVGTPGDMIIRATFRPTRGRGQVQATVQGSPDSIALLIDQLAAQLLARRAGESEDRLTALTATSLPALRAYLDGNVELRAGNYRAASVAFMRALASDSLFMPAIVAASEAFGWGVSPRLRDSLNQAAWRHRDRLSRLDRMRMAAKAGVRSPGVTPYAERLSAAERYAAAAPDHAVAWFTYADYLYHFGEATGISDALMQSRIAFDRALTLDSTLSPVLEHLPVLYHHVGDTAGRSRAIGLALARDSTNERRTFIQWFDVAVRGDTASMQNVVPANNAGFLMAQAALGTGVGVQDVDRRIRELPARGTPGERRSFAGFQRFWLNNLGRPRELRRAHEVAGTDTLATDWRVLDALFWDGDSADALHALAAMRARQSSRITDARAQNRRAYDLISRGLWALERGRFAEAEQAARELRPMQALPDTLFAQPLAAFGVLLFEAALAHRTESSSAAAALSRLDSAARTIPTSLNVTAAGNLVAARLWEQRGDLRRALAAVRRKEHDFNPSHFFLSTFLREEGRLADAVGDREGAIQAYTHFLALRFDPEPALRPEVERIRTRVAQLTRASAGR